MLLDCGALWKHDATFPASCPSDQRAHLLLGTMPFLSIFHAVLDLGFFSMTRLQPVYALVGVLSFFCAWSIQVGFWAQCDF